MTRPGHLDADYLEHMSADALRSTVYRLLEWANLGRPLGTGDCAGCGDFKMLYKPPHAADERCADCRRTQDEGRSERAKQQPRTVDFTDHVNVAPDGRPGWQRIAQGKLSGQFVVVWERGSSE